MGRDREGSTRSTGNFSSEIRRSRSIFARGMINIPRQGTGRETQPGGGESIHCFEETRHARVPAHCIDGRFGGSMHHCCLGGCVRFVFIPLLLSVRLRFSSSPFLALSFSLPLFFASTLRSLLSYAFSIHVRANVYLHRSFQRVSLSISAPTHPLIVRSLVRPE